MRQCSITITGNVPGAGISDFEVDGEVAVVLYFRPAGTGAGRGFSKRPSTSHSTEYGGTVI